MKSFIQRNAPTLFIGALTLGVFLFIIFASQNATKTGPTLIEVPETELITSYTPIRGPQNAKVTLVVFSDFQCPACKAFEPLIEKIVATYPDKVRLAYRNFPLPQHQYARKAAEAAMAVSEEGKFWEYSKLLFENQEKLEDINLVAYAQVVGVDPTRFRALIAEQKYKDYVKKDMEDGVKYGVSSTPTFFLNGKQLQLKGYDDLFNRVEALVNEVYQSTPTANP